MSNTTTYPVPADYAAKAHLNEEQYKTMYQASINDPDVFWAEQAAEFLSWDKPWTKVREYDFTKGEAAWFIGGKLNMFHALNQWFHVILDNHKLKNMQTKKK